MAKDKLSAVTFGAAVAYVKKTLDGSGAIKGEKGDKGDNGESAYESAIEGGFDGTKTEFDTALSDINMTKAEMLDILRGGENA